MTRALFLLLSLSALGAADAQARSTFPGQVPNGAEASCLTCHTSPTGGPSWNDFGLDVRANLSGGMPDWSAVVDLDSDGDGQTNGEELGDPCGTWTGGAAPRRGAVSNPGDANDTSDNPNSPDCTEPPTDAPASTGDTGTTDDGGGGGCNQGGAPAALGLVVAAGLLIRRRRN